MRVSLIVPFLCAACLAQEAPLTGPVAGWVYDGAARALRPMIGAPGSAHLGAAVESGIELAAFSPGGRRVAAVREGSLYVADVNASEWIWQRLAGDAEGVATIAWNRAGNVAAAYDAVARRITMYRNFGEAPEALAMTELPAGKLISMAAEDDAVVAGFEDGDAGGVYLITADTAVRIATAAQPSALAVGGDGRDLYIADLGRNEILRAANFREPAGVELMAGAGQGIDEPSALALSKDGAKLTAAVKDALVTLDLSGASPPSRIDLAFRPTRLEPLGEGAVMLLTRRSRPEDVLQVLDLGGEPVARFVPAGEAAPGESVR
jgi:hypothetical protein